MDLTKDKIRVLGIFESYDQKLSQEYNFLSILNSVKEVSNIWKQRNLTLAGKINIFKSLALSKAIFVCTMKNAPQKFIDDLNHIQKEFLWNGKPKIKHSTIVSSYANGGYNSVDVESKIHAIRISWIKRLLEPDFHQWKLIPNVIYQNIGGLSVFHSNLSLSKSSSIYTKVIPTFYANLLQSWQKVCNTEPESADDICSQSIWNNRFILVKGQPIFNSVFYQKGIVTIYDLLDENGRLNTWQEIKTKFSLPRGSYIYYYGIVKVIPNDWKNTIQIQNISQTKDQCTLNFSRIGNLKTPLQKSTVKSIYTLLITSFQTTPTAQCKLSALLRDDAIDWKLVYELPRKVTIESYMRVFQYKILHNILFLNNRLFKINYADSPLCSLCKEVNETVVHLFCECRITVQIWTEVKLWLSNRISIPNLCARLVLVGKFIIENEHDMLLNHLLLLFKSFIYSNRSKNMFIRFTNFHKYVAYVEKVEQNIAASKNKLDSHFKKWHPILDIL